jgi:hypothetical protein
VIAPVVWVTYQRSTSVATETTILSASPSASPAAAERFGERRRYQKTACESATTVTRH